MFDDCAYLEGAHDASILTETLAKIGLTVYSSKQTAIVMHINTNRGG
jgi:hypothetical protein